MCASNSALASMLVLIIHAQLAFACGASANGEAKDNQTDIVAQAKSIRDHRLELRSSRSENTGPEDDSFYEIKSLGRDAKLHLSESELLELLKLGQVFLKSEPPEWEGIQYILHSVSLAQADVRILEFALEVLELSRDVPIDNSIIGCRLSAITIIAEQWNELSRAVLVSIMATGEKDGGGKTDEKVTTWTDEHRKRFSSYTASQVIWWAPAGEVYATIAEALDRSIDVLREDLRNWLPIAERVERGEPNPFGGLP